MPGDTLRESTTARAVQAPRRAVRFALAALGLCGVVSVNGPLPAQSSETPWTAGAPYVPTPWPVVKAMLELAQVKQGDFLLDLGSGDGRVVIEAARSRGARGMGVELDADLVRLSNDEARRLGVASQAQFRQQDLFETDLTQATVITMYLLPELLVALRPRLSTQLAAGTRIVSHDFRMGDWKPDAEIKVDTGESSFGPPHSMLYLWIVPAFVNGVWEGTAGQSARTGAYRLDLRQQFQQLTGTMRMQGRTARLDQATIAGARFHLSAVIEAGSSRVRHTFEGRSVAGELIGTWTSTPVRAGAAGGAPAVAGAVETRAGRVDSRPVGARGN